MNSQANNDTPGLIAPPPIMLAIAIVAAALLDWLTGLSFLAAPGMGSAQTWLGLIITAAGVALGGMGVREFSRGGTNVNPYEPALKLVTSGPYRYTRNPMYLGMVTILLGLSLMFSLEWGVILTPVLWFAFDRLIIAREETYLTAKFGEPYRTFLTRTRRWL
jgi:protein-S-isoprenylcysteine O-methyltransferase Ste14